MKKLLSLVLALLMVIGLLPAMAEGNAYTSLYSSEITTLNYLTTTVTNNFSLACNLVDTLVEYDRYGQLQPSLAESWVTSEDGLTWTFTIRKGVKWVDAQCNVVAEVTANDFIESAKYILNKDNASSGASILRSYIAGAKAFYDQETDDFATVGIKALDDYTLEYTLMQPTPFFLSMLDYVSFMPVYGPFLAEKGADFGLATGNDTILYCGAYVLSEFAPQERRVLSKNTEYWDIENVFIEKLSFTYNAEASTISPEMYLRGEVDSASISTTIAKEWLSDPEKADLIRPSRPTSFYSYFYAFNYDPQFGEEYEPENWKKAVVNENFRKSLYYGFDRLYARVINDGDAAEELMFNSITPKNFVHLNGVDYSNMGALAEISALGNGTYQPDKALEYKEAAKKELEEAGVKLPVVILLPYGSGDAWADESQAVESQLEGLLGTDYIDIVVEHSMANSFVSDVRKAGNYAICKTNWGPDYDDPQTFTEPFSDGSFASPNKYQFAYKNEDMDEVMAPYYELVIKAMAIYDDMEARYLAFAEAEAYLIEHAILIPFGFTTGGYSASRIDPFTVPFTACGMSKERYKGVKLLDAPMSTDQYYDALDQWESEVAALAQD
ncbi:MAG: peptide ABC transporter substrate-binding protein [Clostridia bacterium]|nr:peptide ABC transporter substrate-binding protein [Clostridia bacterium]MBR5382281.1 peptide ABC transporter substrate-binding protein [Clostridia bacterium]